MLQPDPLAFAAAYARRGWVVFPLAPRSKSPMKGSNGFHDASRDEAVIDGWWGRHPDRELGIGIATGAISGCWVLDVDDKPHAPGPESLAALEAEHGPLPNTVECTTGSGGRHLFFKWDPIQPVSSRPGVRPGLDTRGDGGYVATAPTVHPVTGQRYTWLRPPWSFELAAAPLWLLVLGGCQQPEAPAASTPRSDLRDASAYARVALDSAFNAIVSAPNGKQQETLARQAFGLGKAVAAGRIAEGDAHTTLVSAGLAMVNHRPKQPWTYPAVVAIVERCLLAGSRATAATEIQTQKRGLASPLGIKPLSPKDYDGAHYQD